MRSNILYLPTNFAQILPKVLSNKKFRFIQIQQYDGTLALVRKYLISFWYRRKNPIIAFRRLEVPLYYTSIIFACRIFIWDI